jgi:hypothetical protein
LKRRTNPPASYAAHKQPSNKKEIFEPDNWRLKNRRFLRCIGSSSLRPKASVPVARFRKTMIAKAFSAAADHEGNYPDSRRLRWPAKIPIAPPIVRPVYRRRAQLAPR